MKETEFRSYKKDIGIIQCLFLADKIVVWYN